MANEQPLDKPAAAERKTPRSQHSPKQQPPQIQPPLLNDGPELMRDSHC